MFDSIVSQESKQVSSNFLHTSFSETEGIDTETIKQFVNGKKSFYEIGEIETTTNIPLLIII